SSHLRHAASASVLVGVEYWILMLDLPWGLEIGVWGFSLDGSSWPAEAAPLVPLRARPAARWFRN
ncbi:MAG TPA: hypothetical protein VH280_08385, partial [Verrucomicrobiae bacterium]|nr:hypothetical protein [Verrucomicrobiae bacterium]